MQLPNLQFIRSIPVWGPRLYEALNVAQEQVNHLEVQGNLNATGEPPVPPPPDALNVTNGPSGEFQIAITHNGEFNRGTSFHVQWDTSSSFSNPHNMDLGASRNDSSLYLPGQTVHFRASAASPNGANSAWTYFGKANAPIPVVGGVRGTRAPGMGSGTGAPGDQSGGPGPIQSRNSASGYNWRAQQRTAGVGFGASAQGTPAGIGASAGTGGGGGGGAPVTPVSFLTDTHANRLANYPSVNYALSAEFYESDRTVTYWVQNAAGTVNTSVSGTTYTVTWATGNHFINTGTGFNANQWSAGTPIVINGMTYAVKAVASPTSLTLATSAGTQTGVNYSVASGRWVYLSGEFSSVLTNIPTDLGENETVLVSGRVALGFLFFENNTYFHQIQWNVSGWQRGPGDLEHSDTFHEFGAAPTDGGWHACDGSSVVYMKYDGSNATRIVPNLASTPAYALGGSSYSNSITAAVAPTVTAAGIVSQPSFSGDPSGSTNVLNTGGSTAVVPAPFTPGGTVSQPSFTGTTNQPVSLAGGDPIANFPVVKYYRR